MKKYHSLRAFFSYLNHNKLRLIIVGLAFLIANINLALLPIFIGKLVSALSQYSAGNLQDNQPIYLYTGILLALPISHFIMWHTAEFLYIKLLVPMQNRFENIVFKTIINKPYPYFIDKFTGKISSYIGTLGREMREFIEVIMYNYMYDIVKFFAMFFILLTVNWQTAFIFITASLLMVITGKYTIRRSALYEKKQTNVRSNKDGKIIDSIANFVNVKSFRHESVEYRQLCKEQDKVIKAQKKSYFWNIIFWASMGIFVRWIIWPTTILFNVYMYMHGQINLEQITTLLAVIVGFSSYIWGTVWNVSQFNLRLARIEESYNYLFNKTNIVKDYFAYTENHQHSPDFKYKLQINNLSFAYPDKPKAPVLNKINLTIKYGQKIGIVGKSGSGKTTIIKLLLGYYPFTKGMVTLDSKTISYKQLLQYISYVPQDTILFHRSIRDNIAYGTNNKVTDAEIIQASKNANAHEFIVSTSKGYNTLVGERGIKLSTGQRQRIAIARAFLSHKPILILDEATSALDSESEVLVQQALEALWKNKTVIAVAHRLSTLRNMDTIVTIEDGRVIEQGNHSQLIANKGRYYSLWQHQSDGILGE